MDEPRTFTMPPNPAPVGTQSLREQLRYYLDKVEAGEVFRVMSNSRTKGYLIPPNRFDLKAQEDSNASE